MESVHPLLPQCAVPSEPLIQLLERLGADGVHPELRVVLHFNESGLAQHPKVAGDTRAGDRQLLGEFRHCGGTAAQLREHRAAMVVREGEEYGIHRFNVPEWVRNMQGTYAAAFWRALLRQ